MIRFAQLILLTALLCALCMVQCGKTPSDPTEDPTNAVVSLFLPDNNNTVQEGMEKLVGVRIDLPKFIDYFTLHSSCGDLDSTVTLSSTSTSDTLFFSPIFHNEGNCTLRVTAVYKDTHYNEISDSLIVYILEGLPTLTFSHTPTDFTTHTGIADTLRFAVDTGKGMSDVSFSVSCEPEVDSSEIVFIESDGNDSALIRFDPENPAVYTVTLTATADTLTATASVTVTVLASMIPDSPENPQTLITGTPDTLIFTLTQKQIADGVTMELVDPENIPEDIAAVITSGSDSLIIAVNATEEETLSFSIVTSNGALTDTTTYTFSIVERNSAVWETTSATVDAVEGQRCSVDLNPYLFEGVIIEELAPTATIGSFNDSGAWYYTPSWGSETTVAVTITGKRGETSQDFSLTLNVASGDETAPEITLLSPATENKTVASSQITVSVIAKDAQAGIDNVTFTTTTDTVTGSMENDSTWSGVITGLAEGTATDVVITATDKSMKKNRSTKTIILTYDATMEDDEAPVIARTAGPRSGDRVTTATATITNTITDDSGVDSVWWTLNDAFIAALVASDKDEYTISYELTDFGENLISLHAKDGSTGGNEGSKTITVNYNTEPSAITISSPVNSATDESTSPTFAWNGGDDADGDGVTFTVVYGTSPSDMIETATVSGKTATPNSPLEYNTTWYWQVTGTSASTAYPDEVQSVVASFTTEAIFTVSFDMHGGDAIQSQTVVRDGHAQEPPAPDRDGYAFKGWFTSNTYSTEFDFGTPVTADRTIHAQWVAVYTVTYHANGADGGNVPTDNQEYESGEMVTVAGNTGGLNKNGYDFSGWTANQEGTGTVYTNPTTIQVGSAAIHLYAKWEPTNYSITYNLNGGTNGSNPASFTAGSTVTFDDASKTAYVFKGWYTANTGGSRVTSTQGATGPLVLYARWAIEDIDGNTYTEVTIGNQVWMVENFRATRFNDGTSIPLVRDSTLWNDLSTAAYCFYENTPDINEQAKWGALYNWYAVSHNNFAPLGWRMPTESDWRTLYNYLSEDGLSTTEDYDMVAKAVASKTDWEDFGREGSIGNNPALNNETNLTILPAGRLSSSEFYGRNRFMFTWSITEYDTSRAYFSFLQYDYQYGLISWIGKDVGKSVRLMRNVSP